MRLSVWLRDSITRRFALAIGGAVAACLLLNLLADVLIGGPPFVPSPKHNALNQLADIVQTLAGAAPDQRAALAEAAATPNFRVAWSAAVPPAIPDAPALMLQTVDGGNALVATLRDGGSVIFTPPPALFKVGEPVQATLRIGIVIFSILIVSAAVASSLARPIHAFAAAARRFGSDPNAQPMDQQGPDELRLAIDAFNTMQAQIQRLVAGQVAMFAAISHDLRTPLTRMRLRGELIEDSNQQAKLLRDVDEMQSMVASVLAFLRDNAADEETTSLDLAELLLSIVDDCADGGTDVAYAGPRHAVFHGRPVGLRRAFGNLVGNAIKYGGAPAIELRCDPREVTVTVTDQGPGIPPEALEKVFTPFLRLETSRNRSTGGVGLGLAAARAVFRAHGGNVTLSNLPVRGLRATVAMPVTNGLPRPAGVASTVHGLSLA